MPFTTTGLASRRVQREIDLKRSAIRLASGAGKIFSKLARFAGYAFGGILRFFPLDFSSLWDIFVEGYFALKYFDWNQTDKELEKEIENNNRAIATAAASTLGTALGWGVVRLANFFSGWLPGRKGAAAATAQGIKIPVLSARIGLALAEEGNEEVTMQVRRFLQQSAYSVAGNMFIKSVLAARKNEWFGMESITKERDNGSISEKIDKKIETLPKFWQRPAEAAIDAFEDAIIEAGYVISFTIDDHVAAMQYAQKLSGEERTIDIKPNEKSEEILSFSGTSEEVKQAVAIALPLHKAIEDRDIGQFVGEPLESYVSPEPLTRSLRLIFYSKPEFPFSRNNDGTRTKEATIKIPDAKAGLNFQELKAGIPKFQRGNIYVHCKMSNGRAMSIWAVSKQEGKKVLEACAKFSTAKIKEGSFRASEGDTQHVETASMFPAYACIFAPDKSKPNTWKQVSKFPLWADKK
jgi:hypothetical protein